MTTKNKSKKVYAVATDVSPSEQLGDDPHEIKVMAKIIGLYAPDSFDQVGSSFDVENSRLTLRKWAGSSNKYRHNFIDHLSAVHINGQVMVGADICDCQTIRKQGSQIFQDVEGRFPKASSFSKKGEPRLMLGGYKVDGKEIDPFEVLQDDLCVMGWIAGSLFKLWEFLCECNDEIVKLDIIIDRLPLEQGDYNKATLLKKVLAKMSDNSMRLVGVPDPNMVAQRDLFVDNVAGLMNHILKDQRSDLSEHLETLSENPIRFLKVSDWVDDRFNFRNRYNG